MRRTVCKVITTDSHEFFLTICESPDDDNVRMELTDVTKSWVGHLNDAMLTPPKFGVSRSEFRQKFLHALHHPGDSGNVMVEHSRTGAVNLAWSAMLTQDADIGGIMVKMQQLVRMEPEAVRGLTLRSMLCELASDLIASEATMLVHRRSLALLRVRLRP